MREPSLFVTRGCKQRLGTQQLAPPLDEIEQLLPRVNAELRIDALNVGLRRALGYHQLLGYVLPVASAGYQL